MDINRQSMLVDMLMKVPADAVLWVEHETGGPVGVKIGPLCRNAAAALSTVRPGATRDDIIRLAKEALGKPEPSAFVKPGIKVGVRTQ